jgi:hypothetical protein
MLRAGPDILAAKAGRPLWPQIWQAMACRPQSEGPETRTSSGRQGSSGQKGHCSPDRSQGNSLMFKLAPSVRTYPPLVAKPDKPPWPPMAQQKASHARPSGPHACGPRLADPTSWAGRARQPQQVRLSLCFLPYQKVYQVETGVWVGEFRRIER